ncbi:Pycsar system effector family protein [Streptomyces griseoviridis]|uniref:Pycsar effector protein domain-containing protein n=1 Tax=Streptomyces griseoviridis TaxID=45398 RepID=A0A918L9D7_STRGD|nr:Pycsar system effector family protein [Streptomyces niveoruber]GGS23495.1 hypothetical protein GCM10010238_09390 [Streptomyces niveoruber]
MTPDTTATDTPGLAAGTRLLADLRGEIARADTKATVLVGALGVLAGVLTALLTDRDWSPARLAWPSALLWWAGTLALSVALLALLLAVLPRYGRSHWTPGRPLTYFGDVHRAARTGDLDTALTTTGNEPARSLLISLTELSRIAARKHFWVRTGLIAFGSAAVLFPGAMLVA